MPKLTVALDESDYSALQERAVRDRMDEPREAAYLIKRGVTMIPAHHNRAIILSGQLLDEVEKRLGGMPVLHAADLLEKLDYLASISFEHVQLPFSPAQLAALQEKASRQGKTVEELIEVAAPRIYEQFFDLLPR